MSQENLSPPLASFSSRKAQRKTKTKTQLKDDSIMGTNNSSIVSKRSVERLYFPNEPHFLRHFVKKPQRRSPLINRGYWLRMKAIEHVVRQFLEQPSIKRRVVVNLGCGYDPLPWQFLTRYPTASTEVIFVDIDYADLIRRKRDTMLTTSQLTSMFTNIETSEGDILFRSDEYVQIGCDLRDLASLQRSLTSAIKMEGSSILLVAEVSIAYMDVCHADALIEWAGKLPDARFCLLEQLLPNGIYHPFAKTMMAHFDNIQTPLRPVRRYSTTSTQKLRFKNLGWPKVNAQNLWELWGSADFLTSDKRKALDSVEPFDEWEELALFGCHYVLLVAESLSFQDTSFNLSIDNGTETSSRVSPVENSLRSKTSYAAYYKGRGLKRFASALPVRGMQSGEESFGSFGGMGLTTRVDSIDIYGNDRHTPFIFEQSISSISPSSRMCHTTTDMGGSETLLVGGRTSPDAGFADCWLYHKWLGIWERVSQLPSPRYRHQAVYLGDGHVLISPGKSSSKVISQDYLVWHRQTGWLRCDIEGNKIPLDVYGHVFCLNTTNSIPDVELYTGFLAGGISMDGIVQNSAWHWKLTGLREKHPVMQFSFVDEINGRFPISRFGASSVSHNGANYVAGGIVQNRLLESQEEIFCIKYQNGKYSILPVILEGAEIETTFPLLIGITLFSTPDSLVVVGGSAVCFSFGTFWNKGCYTLSLRKELCLDNNTSFQQTIRENGEWRYMHTILPMALANATKSGTDAEVSPSLAQVPRLCIKNQEDFKQIVQAGKPIILKGLDVGPCISKWSITYLKEHVGVNREVVVHEPRTEVMDFVTKNFSYTTMKFGKLLDEITNGKRLYMRSLSSKEPLETPADIARDFPTIAEDFQLPPILEFVQQNMHSAPLRISGGVSMWLHYDVMANTLCQILGGKKLLLFPPSDIKYFGFEHGASSSSADVFNDLAQYSHCHPHEALLEPGDILFIPPLWLHSASPFKGISIAVNIFFRNLLSGYAAGRDVYGNRDLHAYNKGRQDVQKILKSFDGFPADVRGFYLQRLVAELEGKAH